MVGWPVWEADNPATVLQRFGLIYVTGHSFNLSAFAVSTCLPAWTKGSLRSWRIRLSLKGSRGGQLLLGCAWQPSLLSLQWGSSFLKGVIPAVQAGLTSTCIYKRWRQAEPRPRWCLWLIWWCDEYLIHSGPESQVVPVVRNLPANAGDVKRRSFNYWVGKIPWRGACLSNYSILAWRIPWIEEPGGLQFMGLQRVGHD